MTARYASAFGPFTWHPDPTRCPHADDNACPACDFDGYYRQHVKEET